MSAPDTSPRPSRRRRPLLVVLPLVAFLVLAGLFFVRLWAGDPSRIPSALTGQMAPKLNLPPLAGLTDKGTPVPGIVSTDLAGKVLIVNVWASWCVPCREEHPVLMGLSRDPRLVLVGLNYKDQPDNARRFLGTFGLPYSAVGVDPNGRAAIDWGVYGVPETFVIAPDGTIAQKFVGPLSEQTVRDTLLPLIARLSAKPGA